MPAPRFQPFDPNMPVDITGDNLPHWTQEGATYFVTFRLGDSLPKDRLEGLKLERTAWLRRNPQPWSGEQQREYRTLFPLRVEAWLDAGAGSCVLAQERPGKMVEDALRHFDGERYILDDYAVMPNHVHVIVLPNTGYVLRDIIHSWKSFTSNQINEALGRTGMLWLDESYDHIVRSVEELEQCRTYIRENPQKANLRPGQYRLGRGTGIQ